MLSHAGNYLALFNTRAIDAPQKMRFAPSSSDRFWKTRTAGMGR